MRAASSASMCAVRAMHACLFSLLCIQSVVSFFWEDPAHTSLPSPLSIMNTGCSAQLLFSCIQHPDFRFCDRQPGGAWSHPFVSFLHILGKSSSLQQQNNPYVKLLFVSASYIFLQIVWWSLQLWLIHTVNTLIFDLVSQIKRIINIKGSFPNSYSKMFNNDYKICLNCLRWNKNRLLHYTTVLRMLIWLICLFQLCLQTSVNTKTQI